MRKLQVQVLTRDGRKSIYETDRSRNVADLKKHIGRTMNVPMAFSRLTYKGRLLANDSILEDEGVKRMSTLELFWQPLVLTPKQYRERELELEKLDQKQRHVARIAENYEQAVKSGGHERTPSGLRRTRDHIKIKRSLSADDMNVLTHQLNTENNPQADEDGSSSATSSSSDELDFLAAYWCCPEANFKKSYKNAKVKNISKDGKLKVEAVKPQDTFTSNSIPGNNISRNQLKHYACHHDVNDQRYQSAKLQPFRNGMRLTTGRMSRSIITNIRKNKKNCKK